MQIIENLMICFEVLDCSKEQVAEIQKYLDEEYEKPLLWYIPICKH